MQTVIHLRLSELGADVIDRVKSILKQATNDTDPQISIMLPVMQQDEALDLSNQQFIDGKIITFTMEELADYIKKPVE